MNRLLSLLQLLQAVVIPNIAIVEDNAVTQLPTTGTIGGANFFWLTCLNDDIREIQPPSGLDFNGTTVRLCIQNESGGALTQTTFAASILVNGAPGLPGDDERTFYDLVFLNGAWSVVFESNPLPIA